MKVQNIVIPARDFNQTVNFYRNILCLTVLQESVQFCFLSAGGVNIAIHPLSDDNLFAPMGHGIYLDFTVDNLNQVRQRLEEAEVPILREWVDHETDFLAVADPNGNLLELYEAPGANESLPAPKSPSSKS